MTMRLVAATRVGVRQRAKLLDEPGGQPVGEALIGDTGLVVVEQTGDRGLTKVDFQDGSEPVWIPTEALVVDDAAVDAFDLRTFVEECRWVERMFDGVSELAPFYIPAELVLTRAICETKLTPPFRADAETSGPLLLSSAEWQRFLSSGLSVAQGYLPLHRTNPYAQIRAAAYRLSQDAKALMGLIAEAPTDDAPAVPSPLELWHAYLLGSPNAAHLLAETFHDDPERRLDDVLRRVLSPAQMQALFEARSGLFSPQAAQGPVREFVERTQAQLAEAMKTARALLEEMAPGPVVAPPPPVVLQQAVPQDVAPVPRANPVPFANLGADPHQWFWPLVTHDQQALVVSYLNTDGRIVGRAGRRFLADRAHGARFHVGIDLFCEENDVVLACADGRVVNFFRFYKTSVGEISFALLIEHAGVVINYGEVKATARSEFGWKIGETVQAGQPIARVSSTNMIHLETYQPGTNASARWMQGGARPANLLNPTNLLLNLAARGRRLLPDGQQAPSGVGTFAQPNQPDPAEEDLLTLARTIYGEARGEDPKGWQAVAHVVLNRVRRGPPRYEKTVADVCRQPSQFSCWNENDPNFPIISKLRPGANPTFDQCYALAEQVLRGQLPDNTGSATHYYATSIKAPFWTKPPAQKTFQIGRHRFFTRVK